MKYVVGQKIISKKPHACGNNVWTVTRVGADVKLTCDKCNRSIFLTCDETKKMTKSIVGE